MAQQTVTLSKDTPLGRYRIMSLDSCDAYRFDGLEGKAVELVSDDGTCMIDGENYLFLYGAILEPIPLDQPAEAETVEFRMTEQQAEAVVRAIMLGNEANRKRLKETEGSLEHKFMLEEIANCDAGKNVIVEAVTKMQRGF